jgi:hypothetical protein
LNSSKFKIRRYTNWLQLEKNNFDREWAKKSAWYRAEGTKIAYCQDKDRQKEYPNIEFDFLGFTLRKVCIKDRIGRLQMNFIASVSKKEPYGIQYRV